MLISVVLGYFVIKDISDLSKQDSIYLLNNNNEITAGFTRQGFNETSAKSISDINKINANFQNEDFTEILGDYYKIFFINKTIIESDNFIDAVENLNQVTLIKEYKNNNIQVYPETLLFKLIK